MITNPYIAELQVRLKRLQDGHFALSQVSGTSRETLDAVARAVHTVDKQILEEAQKERRFRDAMWLAAQS